MNKTQLSGSVPNCLDCPMRPFTVYLRPGEGRISDVLAMRAGVRAISKKTILIREGDTVRDFYSVYDGWAACYGISGRGTRRIFDFLIPGDPVNISSLRLKTAHSTIEAITDMLVCTFPCAAMDRYMHSTQERWHRLETVLIEEYVASKKKFMDWATNSSTQRIARLMLALERRLAERGLVEDGSFHFPLRHRHIADALGMTQVHVNRIMSFLRSQGLVELEKQTLRIVERQELVALSK